MDTEDNRSLRSGVIDSVYLRVIIHGMVHISLISLVIFVSVETLFPRSLFSPHFGNPSSQME